MEQTLIPVPSVQGIIAPDDKRHSLQDRIRRIKPLPDDNALPAAVDLSPLSVRHVQLVLQWQYLDKKPTSRGSPSQVLYISACSC